jgi:hypothetical protein
VGVKARGWMLVTAGGVIARGAQVETDAQGRAVTLTTGVVLGRALEAATAAGQEILIDR